jgi:inositol transport system ATP-binding protein
MIPDAIAIAEGRPDGSTPSGVPVLAADRLVKRFFGQTALDHVSLSLKAGEIRALLGENGAGKSTLINLLSGALRPDAGTIRLDGRPLELHRPLDAWRVGVSTIRQEFSLFDDLSVMESMFAGNLPVDRLGLVDWRQVERRAVEALAKLGVPINPRRRVAELSVAEQQLVEIARALTHRSRVVIMDEPTASLSPAEVERLKTIVRQLARDRIAVLYVSHRLEEVVDLCETYTVLRDGRAVAEGTISGVTSETLARMMVGRVIDASRVDRGAAPGRVVFEARGLSAASAVPGAVRDVAFSLRAGEIVGLAGIVGAGRTEIARMIFGLDPAGAGEMRLEGDPFRPRSPAEAISRGVALVPEDRQKLGVFLPLGVAENFAMPKGGAGRIGGLLDRRAERRLLGKFAAALNLRSPGPEAPIASLSGGNQQKVVLARWLALAPVLLIADEPTRGVDIAAKADVHALLRRLASEGVAILLISSDLPEILSLSDRILTLRAGRLSGERSAADASEESLMQLMTGELSTRPTPARLASA